MSIPDRITISFSPTYLVSLLLVLIAHGLLFWTWRQEPQEQKTPRRLKVLNFRTLGRPDKQDSKNFYMSKSQRPGKEVTEKAYSKTPSPTKNTVATSTPQKNEQQKTKPQIQQKDLNLQKQGLTQTPKMRSSQYSGQKLLEAFRANQNLNYLSQDTLRSLSNSDFFVHADVPEGVDLDELNQFEFVFYSFQKRVAEQYFNAFFSQLSDFQRRNPHLQFPMTRKSQYMTARVTFDSQGIIQNIEVLEESDVVDLQAFYIDVLDRMKSIPNPPEALLNERGEMNVYYSLRIN